MTEWVQFLPLLSAFVGAAAAVAGVIVSGTNAKRVADQNMEATERRDSAVHHRQRMSELKNQLLESAIELSVLTANCYSVPWLAAASMTDIYERGQSHISRINVVSESVVRASRRKTLPPTPSLSIQFTPYAGALFQYKEQITLGNVELSGQSNESAKSAQDKLIKASTEWEAAIQAMQIFVAQVMAGDD